MEIEIVAVGGYEEVGRNMTAVRCGKDIVIFDMGLRLDQGSTRQMTKNKKKGD